MMTRSFFSPRASHLHSVIHLILRHWPKIAPSSSSLCCILVLLWHGMVSRARLEVNSWSASGTVGLISDPWWFFYHPSACREQGWWWGDRCTQPGGLWRAGPLSCPFLTEIFILWEYYFEDFSSTMIYMQPTVKKNVKLFTIKHVWYRTVKAHFRERQSVKILTSTSLARQASG